MFIIISYWNHNRLFISIFSAANEIWTTCHLHSLLSYGNLNNLSSAILPDLLKSEFTVTCIPCWVIEIWITWHLHSLLSYWNLNNLSPAILADLLNLNKLHNLSPAQCHSLLSYWNLNNHSLALLLSYLSSMPLPIGLPYYIIGMSPWNDVTVPIINVCILVCFQEQGSRLQLGLVTSEGRPGSGQRETGRRNMVRDVV